MILPYDTETTGLFSKNKALDDPTQPHLVQVSALVVDPQIHRVTQSMNLIVKPDGWDIPEAAEAIHGISTQLALDVGFAEKQVLDIFLGLWDEKLRIAHNAAFDRGIIATAISRYYGPTHPLLDIWLSGQDYCTMESAKPIVQARNVKGALKYPKLTEAYEFFFNEPLDRAHTANADVTATMEIYFALQKMASA